MLSLHQIEEIEAHVRHRQDFGIPYAKVDNAELVELCSLAKKGMEVAASPVVARLHCAPGMYPYIEPMLASLGIGNGLFNLHAIPAKGGSIGYLEQGSKQTDVVTVVGSTTPKGEGE